MPLSKSLEHRMRVLENQAKLAAERAASSRNERADPQMRMPLLVEVKSAPATKRARARGRARASQPDLGDL